MSARSVTIGASDQAASSQPALSAATDALVGEGDGYVDLAVSLAVPGLNPVTVDYATANSSAGAGVVCNADYIGANGQLTFAPGETTKVVRIDLLECSNLENFESFTFGLSAPQQASIRP